MKVYSCQGPAFEFCDGGELFFRTRDQALHSARENTAPDPVNGLGSEAVVTMHEIGPLTHDLVVGMLNSTGWCRKSTTVAVVRNGRVVRGEKDIEPTRKWAWKADARS